MNTESRVLIIEDNDVLRVMLFTILRHQSPLSVDTAMTAEEALEKTGRCDYALILLDIDLPREQGPAFLRRFAEERPDATTFIIAVRKPDSDVVIPQRAGAVLNKPLEIDTLAELVRECAAVVPAPQEPLQCPPSESEIRARMDRGGSFYSN
jgi:DNA-binding response OmpR family regulator